MSGAIQLIGFFIRIFADAIICCSLLVACCSLPGTQCHQLVTNQ